MMGKSALLIGIAVLITISDSLAQTCCSGGVPLSGNIGMPVKSMGSLQVSVNYDLNVLNTLKDGTTKLNDNTRKRKTHSLMGQIGYSFTENISSEVFFSYVRQERIIQSPLVGQGPNVTTTNGLGDAVILVKHRVFKDFHLGLGLKAPLGPSDLTSEIGIPLNADLQPGSGAWDVIYWVGGNQSLKLRPSMSIVGSAIYRATGKNDSYFGNQTYQFGNETQVNIGIADQVELAGLILNPSLTFNYRHVDPDKNKADNISDLSDVPSTGGEWLFVRPAIAYYVNTDTYFQANVQIPVYAALVQTQVTPTYRINLGLSFTIKTKKNDEI
ncbi:MAG: hypothetical protein JXQ96_20375 [Cyclobacteriaceae bacterium]